MATPNTTQPVKFNANKQIYVGECLLQGWGIKETTGTNTAEVDIYDAANAAGASGIPTVPITLLANESDRDGNLNLRIKNGIFITISSGAVEGTIWYSVES